MTVNAVRVSKTSFKKWFLHGPVDQALKTTTQSDQVTWKSLKLTVHDEPIELELWHNPSAPEEGEEFEPNGYAQAILQAAECREIGMTPTEALLSGQGLPAIPVIKGVAVLTGPGCTDFPESNVDCILATLVGMHSSSDGGLE